VLAGGFLLITLIALACVAWSQRRTVERAELELATRRAAPWLEPRLVAGALQASRAIGGPKLVALVAVTVLAAGFGLQWLGHDRSAIEGS
jgi:hypothetical protein